MKSFPKHLPFQAQTAAIRNITDTKPDRETQTAIVRGVNVFKKFQALVRMLAKVVYVDNQK